MSKVTKKDILKSIREARCSHVQWVDYAKALVNGLEITKEQIPLEVTSCEFGKWLYSDGHILLSIFKEEVIEKLESRHKEIHNIYMKIFKIYFNRPKLSYLDRILNRQNKISATQEHIAIQYFIELEKISSELISFLNIIEKKISSIDEKSFEKFL